MQDNVEVAKNYLRALERRAAWHELAAFFDPAVKQVEYPNRLVERGAIRALSDLAAASQRGKHVVHAERYEVRTAIAQDDWVALRVGWSAILDVPLGQSAPGDRLSAEFGMFLQFVEGRIIAQHNYDCFASF